jgi:hypothetical protein
VRPLTGGETTVLAGTTYRITPRIKVANGSGTMIDVTTWLERARWDYDIDQPVSAATVEFRRDFGSTQSLAPFRGDSTLNRDDLAAYSPLLDIGRAITVEVATTALGTAPIAGDYKLLFEGVQDTVNFEKSPVSVIARDKGGLLVDRWVMIEKNYGSEAGVALETVMQQILDDSMGAGSFSPSPVTLYTPVSPSFLITTYRQKKQSVMDALQTLAFLVGWDVRYKWDSGTSAFRLTLSAPPRTKTVPDYTFGPSSYLDITKLNVDRLNIRNYVDVSYPDKASNSRGSYAISDSASITKYGLRYFSIVEDDASPIDTVGEATTLGNSALADLKDPKAEQGLEAHFFWPAELGDLYRHSPNAVHYNSDQDYAVVRIENELTMTTHRSRFDTRGSPAGAYLGWYGRKVNGGTMQPATALALNDFKVIAEDATSFTYGWTPGGSVAEIWAADVLFTEPVPADPWSYVLAGMAPLAAGVNTYTVAKVAEGQVRLLQVEARDTELTPGTVQRVVINAPATQPPIYEFDDIETNTVGTQWWKITERGIAVASVLVQTQIGIQPISGFNAPTRSAGAASTVRGGVLGAGDYEQDVDLDPSRQSWIMPQITLVNGAPPVILGPFGFDRNKLPNILSVKVTGTVIDILADSDTKSIKVTNSGATWIYQVDGTFLTVDVSKTGTNGAAGLGTAASDTYTITAQSDSLVDVGGGTTTDVRAVTVLGATAPGNVSSGLTPALSTPPTVSTDYTYPATGYKRAAGSSTVTMQVTAYLKDGGGVIKDTKIVSASWQTDYT